MSKISLEEIAATAKLARLALNPQELNELQADFESILQHMEVLQTVDTNGIEPMTHAYEIPLRLRTDVAQPSLPPEIAVGQAPERKGDFFVVPAIIATNEK